MGKRNKACKIFICLGILAMTIIMSSSFVLAIEPGNPGGSCGGAVLCDQGDCAVANCECQNEICILLAGFGDKCDSSTAICSEGFMCKNEICKFKFDAINCSATENSAEKLICRMLGTLSLVFAICLVLAVLYFVWGVVQYVTAGGDEQKSEAGKKVMLYGVIALVVISAVAGIMSIITNYANIDNAIALPFIGG